MVFKTRHAFIETVASRSKDVQGVYCGEYDFLLGSASWDRRSVSIVDSKDINASYGLLFHFKKKDANGLSILHKSQLQKFYSDQVMEPQVELIEATAIESNWHLLKKSLWHACQKVGRPLDVFIDLSTTPRYLTLGTLGVGFKNGLIRSLTYGYSEGRYVKSEQKQEIFTEGGWAAVSIPGLSGEWEPHRLRHYVVSVGFEGVKTRQLISKSEPDKVTLLFPEPPVEENYRKKTRDANRALIDDYHVDQSRQLSAHAANVVEALKVLESKSPECFEKENCLYVCCGTKPHSLAFAIRSLAKGEPALLYIVPESHRVSDVESNGIYWQYQINDCSALRGNK